jgi:hypothetical protein
MVPDLSAKPFRCEDAGVVEQIECRAGKRAKIPVTPCPGQSIPGQMRFDLKTHITKLLKIKTAASS